MVRAALGVVTVLRSQRTHSPAEGRLRALAALDGPRASKQCRRSRAGLPQARRSQTMGRVPATA